MAETRDAIVDFQHWAGAEHTRLTNSLQRSRVVFNLDHGSNQFLYPEFPQKIVPTFARRSCKTELIDMDF